jgi:hypothetical protein
MLNQDRQMNHYESDHLKRSKTVSIWAACFLRLSIWLFLFTILLPLSCCQNRIAGRYQTNLPVSLKDDQKLLLIRYLPLGASYEEVQKKFPQVSDLRPEGRGEILASLGLFEAFAPISILNRKATLEFNFKHNKLYSYYFWLEKLDCTTAGKVYQRLQKFYSAHFGKYHEEQESEPGYSLISSYWYCDNFNFGIANNIHGDGCILAWGYQ